jgi:hypothetical protein
MWRCRRGAMSASVRQSNTSRRLSAGSKGHGVGFGFPNLPVPGRVIKFGRQYLRIGGTPGRQLGAGDASWPPVLRFTQTLPR